MMIYLLMIDSEEDRSKFINLYETYRGLMYYIANDILHHREDAEDAVHQAFIKIAENIESIDGTICPKTKGLVTTIVTQRAIDIYRYKQRHQTVEIDSYPEIAIEYDGDNELAACMAKLPVNYKTVLLMKYCYGYSSKETAKLLGLSVANVIKIDQRAKKKLEAYCKEVGLL